MVRSLFIGASILLSSSVRAGCAVVYDGTRSISTGTCETPKAAMAASFQGFKSAINFHMPSMTEAIIVIALGISAVVIVVMIYDSLKELLELGITGFGLKADAEWDKEVARQEKAEKRSVLRHQVANFRSGGSASSAHRTAADVGLPATVAVVASGAGASFYASQDEYEASAAGWYRDRESERQGESWLADQGLTHDDRPF